MEIVSIAVIKLSLIAFLGFCLYRRSVLSEQALKFLSFFIVNVTMPFLIFSSLVSNSTIVATRPIWIFVLISVVIFGVGYLLGLAVSLRRSHEFKKEFIGMVSFQNGGYLPMNIAFFLFPAGIREEFLVYIFLYLFGFNIIFWSVGSFFVFKNKGDRFKLRSIFTPPILSTILALLFVYTNTVNFLPGILLDPLRMVGETSFVFSAIILGCWLAKIKPKGIFSKLFIASEAGILKLFIMPAIFLSVLLGFNISSLLGMFVILQASMPSAVSLPIIADLRGGDSEFASQGVFLTNIASMITIPLWVGLYLKLTGFSF
ncbi:MAG: AEC family transporter [Candidatus Omnitrophica bacterium]|nr:AEC family transporter [Candidatus Omnitrophota bacterium]MDD5429793.1 AEC family transporter [Candidatus Omnitrophota bacterium]